MLFAEIYHDLCDALEMINSLFTSYLISTLFFYILLDTFSFYTIFQLRGGNMPEAIFMIFFRIAYFITISSASHIGYSTTCVGESIKTDIAKIMNEFPAYHYKKTPYYDLLKQFNVRNLKLQTVFFTIDWKIVLAVSKSISVGLARM
jgi:hypothetical protein